MPVKIAHPVGTLEELAERGWKTEEYGSCSKGNKDDNIGCFRYKQCDLKCKERGPENVPYEIVKSQSQGGGMRQDIAPCYAAIHIRTQIEGSGGFFRVVEDEAGNFAKSVTVHERQRVGVIKLRKWEAEHPGEKAPDYVVRGANDPSHPDFNIYDDAIVERAVTPFPRPNQNKALVKDALAAKLRLDEITKRKQKKIDERLNISAADIEEPVGRTTKRG